MNDMQKVDVLAVLEAMIDERRQRAKADVTNVQAMAEYAAANEVYANVANCVALLREVRANGYACYLAGKCDQKAFEARIDNALARVGG